VQILTAFCRYAIFLYCSVHLKLPSLAPSPKNNYCKISNTEQDISVAKLVVIIMFQRILDVAQRFNCVMLHNLFR